MEYEIYALKEKKPLQEGSNVKRFVKAMLKEHFVGVYETNIGIYYNGMFMRVQDIDPEDTIGSGDEIILFSEWKGSNVIIA